MYFNDCQKCFFICPHDRECLLATSSENTFHSSDAHAVDDVSCKPEWNLDRLENKMNK